MKKSSDRVRSSPRACYLLPVVLILTYSPVSAQTKTTFSDLANHATEQPSIGRLVDQGIMQGVSATQFNPDAPMTNGDFAVSVQKMFGLSASAQKTTFTDVPSNSPIYRAVQAVAPYLGRQIQCFGCQLGTTFGPNQPVTRLLVAVTLVNILLSQKKIELLSSGAAETVLSNLADAAALRGPVHAYVAMAMQQGVLTLTPQHAIAALSPMSRADIAVQLDTVQRKFSVPVVRVPQAPGRALP